MSQAPPLTSFFILVYAFNKIDPKNFDESARNQQKKSYSKKKLFQAKSMTSHWLRRKQKKTIQVQLHGL